MSLVTIVVRNPFSGSETPPFVPSVAVTVEGIPFKICVEASHDAVGQINRDPELRCRVEATFDVSNTIVVTCDDERADVNAIAVQLRGHLANAEDGSDIALKNYEVGETVHKQVNERERHADL